MDENIKKLAAELDAANRAWRESLKGPLAPGRVAYRKAVEAYRAFWDAVDAANIPTEEAAKLLKFHA